MLIMESKPEPVVSEEALEEEFSEKVPLIKSELPVHNARWGVHHRSPAMMIGLFVLGISCAICHDSFYKSIHNTKTSESMELHWSLRFGMGLSFVTKASFAAAIGMAFNQYLWVVVRRRDMSLEALDAMFSLSTTPTSFSNREVFSKAKDLFSMAGFIW